MALYGNLTKQIIANFWDPFGLHKTERERRNLDRPEKRGKGTWAWKEGE